MTTLLSLIGIGFLLGMKHALDADHIVAVTTFVSRERNLARASLLGTIWGLGHTTTIFLVGGSMIVLGLVIPPRIGLSLEFGVAIMLMLIGLLSLRAFLRREDAPEVPPASPRLPRLFLVGCVHGMAGSAALALVVLPLMQDSAWALAYLLVFGFGSILGMTLVTAAIAWPSLKLSARFPGFRRMIVPAAGFLTLGFGLFLAYEIGFVEGLFLG